MITEHLFSQSQVCPINIDYNLNSLTHWAAYTGCFQTQTSRTPILTTVYDSVIAPNTVGRVTIPEYLQALPGIQVLSTATTDPFGGFLTIPNINGYQYNNSIKIGSTDVTTAHGGLIRGISYKINVPSGLATDPYTITYAYAMVLENGSHTNTLQPLLQANITTQSNAIIACPSYSYFLPTTNNGATLDLATATAEGFSLSATPSPNIGSPGSLYRVYTKGWTEVTFDLAAYRGQTVNLSFEADNCVHGAHFAYAYIALKNTCGGLIINGNNPACVNSIVTYSVPALANATYNWTVPAGWVIQGSSGTTNILSVKVGNTAGTITVNEVNSCANLNASYPVTVTPPVNAGTASGSSPLCIGATTTYSSNGDAGGTWSSSNTAVATVDPSTGLVTAIAAGSSTITYTISSGCSSPASASKIITVNPNANAGTISGTSPLCIAATSSYSSNGDAGGSWSSSNVSVATVDPITGFVTAIAAGTATITYTISSGCNSPVTASKIVTVNPNANAGTVSGVSPLCIAATTTYSSNGDAGGTWTSSNISVATVNPSTGLVTAIATGTSTITYTISSGCSSPVTASKIITVIANANAGTVTGASPLCLAATATYSSNGDAGGSWSSSNTAVATVDPSTGLVTAIAAGSSTITYTVTGCGSTLSASKIITVNPNANAGTVSGTSPLCIGITAIYSNNGDAGGSWTSSNTAVAAVDPSTGIVTAIAAGTATITYTISSGCNSPVTASKIVTVNPNANAGTVNGVSPLCIAATTTYSSNGDAGGSWTSSNISVATVNASTGLVSAIAAGSSSITYTISSGCASPATASKIITINPNANAGTVSGVSPLCIAATTNYSSTGDAGGSWSSSNTAVAAVDPSTGIVTAIAAGTATITYTISSGCNSPVTASKIITVNPNANAGTVSGTSPLCIAATTTYSSNTDAGGSWTSSNTAVATVDPTTGLVTAVAAGSSTISYTITGCGSTLSASKTFTVIPNANPGTISGTSPLCITATTNYSSNGDAGGSWTSSNTAVATVDPSTGLITAIAVGSSTITYTVTGCGSNLSASKIITVNPNANAAVVSGASPLCIAATTTYSSNGDTGGAWSSSNVSVATIDPVTGLVTAISAGNSTITYTVAGCGSTLSASKIITVSPNANAGTISGTSQLCIAATTSYSSNGDAGGTWSSSNVSFATVDPNTGLVTAIAAGNSTITYTVAGCGSTLSASKIITVNPNANAGTVSGLSPLCIGATATYSSNGDAGGSWSSSNVSVATVDPITGFVTAIAAGSSIITYTVTGCGSNLFASKIITVNPNANAGVVSGSSSLCIGATTAYSSNGDIGGSWSSSNVSVATADPNTGLVAAVSAGTSTITYTVAGCGSNLSASKIITINAVTLNNISGDSTICFGQTVQLSNTTTGGTWSSNNNSIAIINNNGLLNGIAVGNAIIAYTYTNASGCSSAVTKNIYINPVPVLAPIIGNTTVCSNDKLLLSNATIGGKWSSSDNAIATIDSTGSVNIVTAGIFTAYYSVSNSFGCTITVNKNILVNAAQKLSIYPKNDTVCTGNNTNITLNSSLAGTMYKWSSVVISGNVSNNSSNSNPINTNSINDKLINNSNSISAVKYIITAISQNSCSSVTDSAFAAVYPYSTVPNAGPDRVICSLDSIQLNGNTISNGIGTWQQIAGPTNISFSNIHAANAIVKNINNGKYIFAWISSNSICSSLSDTVNIVVSAALGSLSTNSKMNCISNQVNFKAITSNTDSIIWNFGDGNSATTSSNNTAHIYAKAGIYYATVILKNNLGCSIPIMQKDTVKVEELKADFIISSVYNCGKTTYNFKDSSRSSFGISSWTWLTNGTDSSHQQNLSKDFTAAGKNSTSLVIRNSIGCSDTVKADYSVLIYQYPVANIEAIADACKQVLINFNSTVVSKDSIAYRFWNFGNGITSQDSTAKIMYYTDGSYEVKLIVGTVNRCYDSNYQQITIHPTPSFTISGSTSICRGDSVRLSVSGNNNYIWKDVNNNIICNSCSVKTVTPTSNTSYQVIGYSQYGCSDIKTTNIQVIQPFVLKASPADSICVGSTIALSVSGAQNYQWYPTDYLSSTTTASTTTRPLQDITYHVIGKDNSNCFTDTAEIKISVGKKTAINIGLDTVVQSGSLYQFNPHYSGSDINSWSWSGSADLSCTNCDAPTLVVKKDICIVCNASNVYNCIASDTVCLKVFCPTSKLFVPNAFTPDGDGINDKLMVQGTGIQIIKSFRIFNRWGELVFERTNFAPGDPSCAWDGTVRGKPATSDVFVYVCEVLCDAGYPGIFKGNVGLIK